MGAWRSHAVWEERDVIKIPTGIRLSDAAGTVVNPSTAYRMLKDFVQLKKGDVIIQKMEQTARGTIFLPKPRIIIIIDMQTPSLLKSDV